MSARTAHRRPRSCTTAGFLLRGPYPQRSTRFFRSSLPFESEQTEVPVRPRRVLLPRRIKLEKSRPKTFLVGVGTEPGSDLVPLVADLHDRFRIRHEVVR